MPFFPSDGDLMALVNNLTYPEDLPFKDLFEETETSGDSFEFDVLANPLLASDHRLNDTEGGTRALLSRVRKQVPLPNLRESKRIPEHIIRLFQGPGMITPESGDKIVQRELLDLDMMNERRHAIERVGLMLAGTITLSGDLSGTLDFGMASGNKVTPTIEWDLPDTCTPLANIRAWKKLIQRTGRTPKRIYLPSSMLDKIMRSVEARGYLSDAIKDRYFATGVVQELCELRVIIVDGGYKNSSGTFVPFMSSNGTDEDKVVITTDTKVGLHVRGPVVDTDAPEGWRKKFAKSWTEKKSTGRWLLVTEKAMPGLTEPDAIVSATTWAA